MIAECLEFPEGMESPYSGAFHLFSSQESSSKDQSNAPEEAHSMRFASSITPLPSPELSTH